MIMVSENKDFFRFQFQVAFTIPGGGGKRSKNAWAGGDHMHTVSNWCRELKLKYREYEAINKFSLLRNKCS